MRPAYLHPLSSSQNNSLSNRRTQHLSSQCVVCQPKRTGVFCHDCRKKISIPKVPDHKLLLKISQLNRELEHVRKRKRQQKEFFRQKLFKKQCVIQQLRMTPPEPKPKESTVDIDTSVSFEPNVSTPAIPGPYSWQNVLTHPARYGGFKYFICNSSYARWEKPQQRVYRQNAAAYRKHFTPTGWFFLERHVCHKCALENNCHRCWTKFFQLNDPRNPDNPFIQ